MICDNQNFGVDGRVAEILTIKCGLGDFQTVTFCNAENSDFVDGRRKCQ